MTATTVAKKPRVIAIVIFCFLEGLLSLAGGALLLGGMAVLASDPTYASSTGLLTILAYVSIILGVLDLVTGVLLLMYKRIGLMLAAVTFGLGLLLNIYSQVTGSGGLTTIGGIILDLAVLYYVYQYLTREPDKTFFS